MPLVLRKSCNFFRKCCMVKYWRQNKIFRQDIDLVEDETYKGKKEISKVLKSTLHLQDFILNLYLPLIDKLDHMY